MKKILPIFLVSALLLSSCSIDWNDEKKSTADISLNSSSNNNEIYEYHNTLCGYSVKYPSFWYPQGESDNGDGQSFQDSTNFETLRVFSYLDSNPATMLPIDLQEKFRREKIEFQTVAAEKITEDSFEISGFSGDLIVMKKTISHKENDCYADLILRSSKTDYENNRELIKTVFDSFK